MEGVMYTGIVEDLGNVAAIKPTPQGAVITVKTALLVDVLDQHVGPVRQIRAEMPMREKREAMSGADAKDLDAVEHRARRATLPPSAQEPHLVSLRREAAENFVQVDLGAAALGIFAILPVDDEDAH